ncbi:Zinc knuckle (CCHC-type) family protein [Euphorbia peplus]|nr:Zinc knuckle (CCHC-type) family protein [Euphorbia peplus]
MATRPDIDDDEDFSEIYKEYTGPPAVSTVNHVQDRAKPNKRSNAGSDEEEEPRDPNAVPTDFTSREAKVWEAKSKATERNWKKRKEEEMICKLCGDAGHFTQGCPTTLGANRKTQDFFERVAAREKHVKALFTDKVIQRIEKDIGCKIKMEEKFIIVSGRDRLILAKGVDAVHKVIKGDGDQKGSSSFRRSRSRSPERSPVGSRLRRSDSQRSHSGHPRDAMPYQPRFGRQKSVEDRVRGDPQKFARGSPQAYGNDGGRSRSSHSKSPGRPPYAGNSYGSYDSRNQSVGGYRNDGWETERRGHELPPARDGRQFEYSTFPQTLEDLELEHKREAIELGKIRDKEEDEENYTHRETLREMRENYMQKLAVLRNTHARQWEEFLQLDAQRREQTARQQIPSSGFGGYKQHSFPDYDGSAVNPHYNPAGLPMDSRARYPNHVENYSSRTHESFGEFQRQRREEFGKAYDRY